jgi:hypothetical protein
MAFQPGFAANAKWQPNGTGGLISLNITGWNWTESVNALDVTHTGTGGQSAFIAGVLTGDFSFDANLDPLVNPPYSAATALRAGQKGIIQFVTNSATTPWSVPIIIEKADHKSAVNGLIQYTVSGKLDQIIGSTTTPYAYPT